MITIILVEPQTPGNIGSIARAMSNFGLSKMIIVNPKCDYLSNDCLYLARHAKGIVQKAKTAKKLSELKFDTMIATTSALGTDSNVSRAPLLPDNLSRMVPGLRKNTAIVFGRDSTGLTNKEIEYCDFVVTIPSSVKYRALNISHAAAIIFYEIFKGSKAKKIGNKYTPASHEEKEVIFKLIDQILTKIPFSIASQRETQKKIWSRIIGKSLMSRREAFAIIGFFKKVSRLR